MGVTSVRDVPSLLTTMKAAPRSLSVAVPLVAMDFWRMLLSFSMMDSRGLVNCVSGCMIWPLTVNCCESRLWRKSGKSGALGQIFGLPALKSFSASPSCS